MPSSILLKPQLINNLLSKILNLLNSKTKKPANHIIRYWEKEFKQVKPKIINNRRYYNYEQIEIFKFIKYLLKDEGMTISGAKKILNFNRNTLDDYNSISLKADYHKNNIKLKTKKILKKIKELKKNGKKNSH